MYPYIKMNKEDNMRKKRNVFIILMAMVLIMSGCGKTNIDMETAGESMDYEEVGSTNTTNVGIALMENGFYYQNKYTQLMYYDYETDQVTYVCSKPNCKHDRMDSECDANINGDSFPMAFWNGRLYYTSDIPGNAFMKIALFSVKPDGSDRKEECAVAEIAIDATGYLVTVYKHYAATTYTVNDTHQRIELMDTDTGKKKVLYDKDDKLLYVDGPYFYYDYAYYSEKKYDKQGKKIAETFYQYNLKTKKVSKVHERLMDAFTFTKDSLIFSDGKAISRIPLAGGKVEHLFDYKSNGDIRYDGQYLYIEHEHDYRSDVGDQQAKCDDHWVDVMKLDGTKVDTIKWNDRGYCLFGDQHVLLFDRVHGEDGVTKEWAMMKKSDIGGKHHFIDLANGKPLKEE